MNGKNIGDIGEAVVLTEFLKYGIEVFFHMEKIQKLI